MASNKNAEWVEERVTCPMCLLLFDGPQTFPCLHTYCKKCVTKLKPTKNELQGADGYECPLCREFTTPNLVRHNFLITELLEYYHQLTERGATTVCKQCKEADATHRCMECRADYCAPCKATHDGFEILQNHQWILLDDIERGIVIDKLMFCSAHEQKLIELNCIQCEKPMCYNCKAITHEGHPSETVDDAIKRIMPEINASQDAIKRNIQTSEDFIADVTKLTSSIVDNIETEKQRAQEAHKILTEKLDGDLVSIIKRLNEIATSSTKPLTEVITDVENKVKEFQRVSSWIDTTTSTAHGNSLLNELQSGLRVKVKQMADVNHEPANLGTCPFDVDGIGLQLKTPTENNMVGSFVLPQVRFSNVWPFELSGNKHAKHISIVKLGTRSWAHHVSMVNGELWIPGQQNNTASMNVFSPSGEPVRKFDLPPAVSWIQAVIPTLLVIRGTSQKQVAALACDSGVYTITPGGQIVQTLSNDKCSDVCIYNGKLYTLEFEHKKIVVFQRHNECWIKERDICVTYTDHPCSWDTLNINNERTFVCSRATHTVSEFTMTGEKVAQHGSHGPVDVWRGPVAGSRRPGTVEAGKLRAPILSGSDATGCMLVCDRWNNRVQLLSADGKWSLTTLKNLDYLPRYAVPVNDRSLCIFGCDNSLHLYQF